MSAVLTPDPNDPEEVVSDDNQTIKANSSDPGYEKAKSDSGEIQDKQNTVNPSDENLETFQQGLRRLAMSQLMSLIQLRIRRIMLRNLQLKII